MKKSIAVILCWFAGQSLSAQNLQVLVQDPQGALPYAVVSVNHRQHYLCDSLGSALLPSETLKAGDTISSSYIGKRPVFALYNPEADGPCILTHEAEETYEVEDVVVVADRKSGRKAFRKYVKPYPHLAWDGLMEGSFQAGVSLPGDTPRQAAGSFSIESRIPREEGERTHAKYYFNLPPELETPDDTSGIGPQLRESIRISIRSSNRAIGSIFAESFPLRVGSTGKIYYLGIREDRHVFRLVYAERNSVSIQILFRVNRLSKEIEQVTYSRIDAANGPLKQWHIEVDCVRWKSGKKGAMAVLSIPQNIRSSYVNNNGLRVELELSQITCEWRERQRAGHN